MSAAPQGIFTQEPGLQLGSHKQQHTRHRDSDEIMTGTDMAPGAGRGYPIDIDEAGAEPPAHHQHRPSDVVVPMQVSTPTQQANTQPGSGSTTTRAEQGLISTEQDVDRINDGDGGKAPGFKEKVVGYAKKTRGTLLGKPEVKEAGQRILQGDESAKDHV